MIFMDSLMKYKFFKALLLISMIFIEGCNTEHTEEAEVIPIAKVHTQPLALTQIADTITAYGSVIALPNNSKNVSVP